MKEVLAQFQIDALLQDIQGGKVPAPDLESKKQKKVKTYDFKLPRKFTKEQLRTVMGVYEIYARHLSSYLTGTLRTFCQVEVASIEETKYYEYSNAIAESALVGLLDLNPVEGTILMEFSKGLSFTIIDKLLGGPGTSAFLDREYTEIEMVLLERLYRNVITYLQDAWSNVAEVKPHFRKFEKGNSISRIMQLDEIVVIVVMNVKIKELTGTLTVCLPYIWLQAINDKLYTKYRMSQRAKFSPDLEYNKRYILSQIYKSDIDVAVNLGRATVQFRDVVNMEVGDVIKLKQSVNDKASVEIDGKIWFYGQIGLKNGKKAVKIEKVWSEDE